MGGVASIEADRQRSIEAKENELREAQENELRQARQQFQDQADQAAQLAQEMKLLQSSANADRNSAQARLAEIQQQLQQQRSETEASRREREASEQALQTMRQEMDALKVRGFTSRPDGWDGMSPNERSKNKEKLRQEAHDQLGIDTVNYFNFAITGATGTGKSSLINALRGIQDNHELAAKTGEIETTVEIRKYPLLEHPNIVLWDLPGAGTDRHPAHSYYMDKKLYAFDCLIVVTGGRFTEIEARLGQTCREFQTPVVFVRNKSDQSLKAKVKRMGVSREEAATELKSEVEKNARSILTKHGLADAMLFIISAKVFLDKKYFPMDEAEFVRYTINCAVERRGGVRASS